jgi:hypothetical protein
MPADEIVRISVLPFNMVNAHLIRNDDGCVLVDVGRGGRPSHTSWCSTRLRPSFKSEFQPWAGQRPSGQRACGSAGAPPRAKGMRWLGPPYTNKINANLTTTNRVARPAWHLESEPTHVRRIRFSERP